MQGTEYKANSLREVIGGFWFKMMEQKDVGSSSPARAPKIATNCWTTIDRSMLEPTEERYPTPKDKEETAAITQEGCNHDKIKSYTCWVSNPQTEKQYTKEVLPLL